MRSRTWALRNNPTAKLVGSFAFAAKHKASRSPLATRSISNRREWTHKRKEGEKRERDRKKRQSQLFCFVLLFPFSFAHVICLKALLGSLSLLLFFLHISKVVHVFYFVKCLLLTSKFAGELTRSMLSKASASLLFTLNQFSCKLSFVMIAFVRVSWATIACPGGSYKRWCPPGTRYQSPSTCLHARMTSGYAGCRCLWCDGCCNKAWPSVAKYLWTQQ